MMARFDGNFVQGWSAVLLMLMAVLGTIVPASASAGPDEQPCQEQFGKLQLTSQEVALLEKLDREQEDFFPWMLKLLVFAEVASVPKSPKDVAVELAKGAVNPIGPDQFSDAVKGLQKISAKKPFDEITLLLWGKHPDFPGYRPKGANYRFFKCLQSRYHKILTR